MKVRELTKTLKGQYTNIIPFNNNHRNAIPFTQLGKEFNGLTGKAFVKVLNEKEVVEYKLSEWKTTYSFTTEELAKGHKRKVRYLIIYFE